VSDQKHKACECPSCVKARTMPKDPPEIFPRSFVPRVTRTYALLEVSAATFADIQARLARAGVLSEYYREYERPLIILGDVGLTEEK